MGPVHDSKSVGRGLTEPYLLFEDYIEYPKSLYNHSQGVPFVYNRTPEAVSENCHRIGLYFDRIRGEVRMFLKPVSDEEIILSVRKTTQQLVPTIFDRPIKTVDMSSFIKPIEVSMPV